LAGWLAGWRTKCQGGRPTNRQIDAQTETLTDIKVDGHMDKKQTNTHVDG